MGTVSQASLNMKAFVIVALVAAVAGEADPYTIGQVLAGQTNGGVITSTTYHGGVKVAGFPYTTVAAAVPHTYGYPYAYYGKREADADPALVYAAGAVPYTYGVLPYAGVHDTNPVHAVAYTGAGLTHSSNVGICTNYVGAVVPC